MLRIAAVLFLLFILYSFIGWLYEMIVTLFQGRKLYNRGFLLGPICPIYGVGALFITTLLSGAENIITIFFVSLLGSAILEYLTSFWMEKLFHVRWWDYKDQPFNLNGRVCLLASAAFGVLGAFLVTVINPFFLSVITSWPDIVIFIIATVFALLFIADEIFSFILVFRFEVAAGTMERDATEEISRHIRELFLQKSLPFRRLMKAFPDLRISPKPQKSSPKRPK